jgi:HAD superfamily hydrolase (TIGR01549 family)
MKIHVPERFARLPDAVLFDLDNTLYAYDPAHRAALQAVRKKTETTLSITSTEFDRAFATARAETQGRLKGTASSHNRLLYFQQTLELLGLSSQPLLALDLEQTYWRTFLGEAELFDGVLELLDELRLAGVRTAIVTDLTTQIQFRKIVYFGLDHHFDAIVTSEEAGAEKPSAAPFRIAAKKIGASASRFWMIGDNAHKDIRGARLALDAATLQKVHRGIDPGAGEEAPDASFENFRKLGELVRRLATAPQPAVAA